MLVNALIWRKKKKNLNHSNGLENILFFLNQKDNVKKTESPHH